MKLNKLIIFVTVIITASLIIIPTVYKITKSHQEALMEVVTKEVIEAAISCKNNDTCKNDKITLKEMYDLNLLDTVVNPLTKEIYNENSYVEIKEDKNIFVVVD